MRTIKINEAETSFSALLASVEGGDEVAITRYGRVVARMIPGARRPLRQGDMSARLETPSLMETGLLAPLD